MLDDLKRLFRPGVAMPTGHSVPAPLTPRARPERRSLPVPDMPPYPEKKAQAAEAKRRNEWNRFARAKGAKFLRAIAGTCSLNEARTALSKLKRLLTDNGSSFERMAA